MLLHDQCMFLLNFTFLGIFSEIAQWVMNYRQATHVVLPVFLVPLRNRLAMSTVPPGDTSRAT